MTDSKIIEINGMKFEVDERTATLRQLSTISVGSRVKVLKDERVYYGVIIGFEPFPENPVVIVAYIDTTYYSSPADIKFLYYSSKSKEQVIVSTEEDKLGIEKEDIVMRIERDISKKEQEIRELNDKKNYFLKQFRSYWNEFQAPQPIKQESSNLEDCPF